MTEIINNMPFDEYLSLDRLSSSAIKDFMISPSWYKQRKEIPFKETAAMRKGTMIHTWMLENPKFAKEYYPVPTMAKKTKAEKELYAAYVEAAQGRELVLESEIEFLKKLPLKSSTKNEVTVLFEINGVPCKSRFDILHPTGIEDLKSINDLTKINRDFANFKYYIQAGFYAQAYFEAFGEWPEFFNFTFVSTGEYFDFITCDIAFDYLEHGRMEVLEAVERFKECRERDVWPGLSGFTIERPGYI